MGKIDWRVERRVILPAACSIAGVVIWHLLIGGSVPSLIGWIAGVISMCINYTIWRYIERRAEKHIVTDIELNVIGEPEGW